MTSNEVQLQHHAIANIAALFQYGSMTDVGNAERFIFLHGDDVRYVQTGLRSGYWVYWTGTHWQKDSDAEVKRMARDIVRMIFRYAETFSEDNKADREKWEKFAIAIQNGQRLASALGHAQYDESINVRPEVFDTHPLLLNCQNGTLDLSGDLPVLGPHVREHLLTQIVPVPWVPDAKSERWEQALKFWMPDEGVAHFMQKFFGSSATGLVLDDIFPILQGKGGTGKSTFINGILATLGDYAKSANPAVVMRRKVDQQTNDLLRLRGARLVVMLETEGSKSFDVETLKRVVAGDNEVARFLYQEYQEFAWTAKWVLGTNESPEASAHDTGTWRRLVRVDFEQKVPEAIIDKLLRNDVKQDRYLQTAIFAWILDGWKAWRAEGLALPAAVVTATAAYRDDNRSPFDDWLVTVVLERGAHTGTPTLYGDFVRWCGDHHETDVMSAKSFGRQLTKVDGLTSEKVDNVTRGWKGIRLRTVDEQVLRPNERRFETFGDDLGR